MTKAKEVKGPRPVIDAAGIAAVEETIRQENTAADARMRLPLPGAPLNVKLQWALETADILPAAFTDWFRQEASYRHGLDNARLEDDKATVADCLGCLAPVCKALERTQRMANNLFQMARVVLPEVDMDPPPITPANLEGAVREWRRLAKAAAGKLVAIVPPAWAATPTSLREFLRQHLAEKVEGARLHSMKKGILHAVAQKKIELPPPAAKVKAGKGGGQTPRYWPEDLRTCYAAWQKALTFLPPLRSE